MVASDDEMQLAFVRSSLRELGVVSSAASRLSF